MPPAPHPLPARQVQSAPYDTEEARTLHQARLMQFGRVGACLGALFLSIVLVMHFVFHLKGSVAAIWGQIGAGSCGAIVWFITRRWTLSTNALHVIDAVSTVSICSVFILMGWGQAIWMRPDLVQLLCATDILALRAFLIPSTTWRTAVLGTLVVLLITVSTWLRYQGVSVHPEAPSAEVYAVVLAIMGLGTVILTALISKTIFGLREHVREAVRLGQYTLLEKIGEGGMGIVYKASHALLRRPTAIKILPSEKAGESNLARFEREVQLTSLLTHPNTVAVYDYGRTATGVLYYAMEYLDGIDLEALVAVAGPQDPGRVVFLLKQLCGALDEAHAVGLIHRDVKPANIRLCPRRGSPDLIKVLDFGLVKAIGEPSDAAATAVDQIIGTPLYMSPEAITAPETVDARSDLYAVGAVGYFLLVGQPPFVGRSAVEVCGHHLHSNPVPPHERQGRAATLLDELLLRCLHKTPASRPQSATEILRALEQCTDVAPWTVNKGLAWWQANEAALSGVRNRPSSSSVAHEQTIAVDLRRRAHELLG